MSNNVKIVYFSKYYNIQNFVDYYLEGEPTIKVENDGTSLLKDDDKCILILPSYEPEYLLPVFLFLEKHKEQVLALVGSGDRNYGALFLYSAFEIEEEYGIPVYGGFENLGMPSDAEALKKLVRALENNEEPGMEDTEFYDIDVDRENYTKYKRASDVTWLNPTKKN